MGRGRNQDGPINILLLGERLSSRSFSGANKALPVLASSLANAGFVNVSQLDLERDDLTIDDVVENGLRADLIVVAGAMTPQWGELDETLALLSRQLANVGGQPPILVGGYAAKSAEDVLRATPVITALFDGEGEEGIVEIAGAVARGTFEEEMSSIRGVCWIDESGRYRKSIASRVRSFDDIDQNFGHVHIPACHNMEIFSRPGRTLKTAQIFTQRGCPWACGFCNKSMESGSVIRLSEESLRSQLRALREDGYTSVYLDVDTFTVNTEAARREAAILHDEGFVWGSNTRIDRIDLPLMQTLVELGCVYMFCGVEHTDPGVAIAVNKFNGSLSRQLHQAESYRHNVRRVYREMAIAGLPSSFFMILGLPKAIFDETRSCVEGYRPTTLEEDIDCVAFGIQECEPDYFNFNLLRFMPGSAAADVEGDSPYSCVRPSGAAPITAGHFLPRLREQVRYRQTGYHGIYRLCESIGPNQPTTTAADPERVYRTVDAAIHHINLKRRRTGKRTQLFVDEEVAANGLVTLDEEGSYRLADLREFEAL